MRDVWEAMSDKTRREILSMLKERNLSAGEIADKFNLTKATVSHHLSVLKAAIGRRGKARADRRLFSQHDRFSIFFADGQRFFLR